MCLARHRLTGRGNRGIPTHRRGTHHRGAPATGLAVIKALHGQVHNVRHNLRDLITLCATPREANARDRRFGSALNTLLARTQSKGQSLDQRTVNMRTGMKIPESDNAAPTLRPRLTQDRIPERLQHQTARARFSLR